MNVERFLSTEDVNDKEANISLLKSEETNMLENIAVNFEKLNQNLTLSVTPCQSVRNIVASPQWRSSYNGRSNMVTTPINLQTFEREKMNTFIDNEDIYKQFGQTQTVDRNVNLFNFHNSRRS